jgi:hypothetical protein
MGPRAGLDGCGKFSPLWVLIPGPSTPYLVIPTFLSRPSVVVVVVVLVVVIVVIVVVVVIRYFGEKLAA